MRILSVLGLLLVFNIVSGTQKIKTICYPELEKCYNNASPFDDLPLPEHPDIVRPIFYRFTDLEDPMSLEQVEKSADLDPAKKLILASHGFGGYWENTCWWAWPIFQTIMKLEGEASQFVFIEWKSGAYMDLNLKAYAQPATNTRIVGDMAERWITASGAFTPDRIRCIGFSLGSHVCSFMAKAIAKANGGTKIDRITSMDPAAFNFDKPDPSARLDKSDATFVDILHASYVGLQRPGIGHAEFFPNGGRMQPGCSSLKRSGQPRYGYVIPDGCPGIPNEGIVMEIINELGCSHYRAPLYYGEALHTDTCDFSGCPCPDVYAFERGQCSSCDESERVTFGWNLSYDVRGNYFMPVPNTEQPFCENKRQS